MKTVLLVFGTRPEAIKMCPLVRELKARAGVKTVVCVSGQHRELLDATLAAFGVTPDYDLSVMTAGQSLSEVTERVLSGVGRVLDKVKPDVLLVHGDTSTAFSAALAAFYRQIPVGHIEAGLRTYDLRSPFPEEFNRQAIGLLAAYHFCPTPLSRENLLREGKDKKSVFVTGNTAIDALKTTVRADYTHPALDWAGNDRLVLVTAHRRENLGRPMLGMFRAIRRTLDEHPDVRVLLPIHPNPAVREAADATLRGCARVRITPPLDVLDFHNLLARAYLVLTDSGGIQEEAPALGKPVLVMRDTTERKEGLAAGTLKLVGTDEEGIYRSFSALLENEEEYQAMRKAKNPYGDGFACQKIAKILEEK